MKCTLKNYWPQFFEKIWNISMIYSISIILPCPLTQLFFFSSHIQIIISYCTITRKNYTLQYNRAMRGGRGVVQCMRLTKKKLNLRIYILSNMFNYDILTSNN